MLFRYKLRGHYDRQATDVPTQFIVRLPADRYLVPLDAAVTDENGAVWNCYLILCKYVVVRGGPDYYEAVYRTI